ncbi:MAG TPA: MgtC/SapB family protein, partial [Candidatus Hydrogenedentes bacterium]|nr:MgtC/SapB family protein [Candidatus Hydrogenedentota bacterium]
MTWLFTQHISAIAAAAAPAGGALNTASASASWGEVCVKLIVAAVLSGLLGYERQRKGRAAGLRTHILVCLGATLVMAISDLLAREWVSADMPVWLDRG